MQQLATTDKHSLHVHHFLFVRLDLTEQSSGASVVFRADKSGMCGEAPVSVTEYHSTLYYTKAIAIK